MPAPTVTPIPADTIHAVRCYLRFTPTGESPTAIDMLTALVDYEGTNETIKNMAPGADNVLRPNRESQKSSEEAIVVEGGELKKVLSLLGGLNKLRKGSAEVWIYDPDDAAGKVKVKIAAFACSLKRDGNVTFSADDFSKMRVRVTNLSGQDLALTLDADA